MSRDRPPGGAAGLGSQPDDELARLAGEGVQDVLNELLGRYGEIVFNVCAALFGARGGKQLLDRTLKRAARGIRSGTGGLPVAPWLFKQAVAEADESGPPADERPASGLTQRFQELSRTDRASVVMRELGGLAYGEIGDVFGISSSDVQKVVAGARSALVGTAPRPTPECEIVQPALLRDDLPPLGRQAVTRHLERCAYCSRVHRGVGALPGLLKNALPKLAPVVITAMIREAVAQAAVGAADAPSGRDGRDDASERARYHRRRSIAAAGVLGLLVVVTALAVSTGRLNPGTLPGPTAGAPFTLPPAFFHLAGRDVKPAPPNGRPRPFHCGAASCPPPLPPPPPPRCTGLRCPPPGCTGPHCKPPRPKPRRCPDGTVEPHCKRPPHTCPPGTIEPNCGPVPHHCPRGTVEPDCHRPPAPCPDGTVEPDCHTPKPPCPDGTVEPDCQVPPVPPPSPPVCTGPHCGHDFHPLPQLCHHHHHDQPHARPAPQVTPAAPPGPAVVPDRPPVGPQHQPERPQPAPRQPEQPPPTPRQPEHVRPEHPQQPERPQPPVPQQQEPSPPPQPQHDEPPQPDETPQHPTDRGHHGPPDHQHHDGGVQAQWAVDSKRRDRSRRFSVL